MGVKNTSIVRSNGRCDFLLNFEKLDASGDERRFKAGNLTSQIFSRNGTR